MLKIMDGTDLKKYRFKYCAYGKYFVFIISSAIFNTQDVWIGKDGLIRINGDGAILPNVILDMIEDGVVEKV